MNNSPGTEVTQPIDDRLVDGAVAQNMTRRLPHTAEAIGFQGADMRFRRLVASPWLRIAEEFLINSRSVRHDREAEASIRSYFTDASAVMLSLLGSEKDPELRAVPLPRSARLAMELGEAMARRRSLRSYTGDWMRLEHLATVLRAAAGVTGMAESSLQQGGQVTLRFRSTPSGGGLYPIDLYVAAQHIRDLEQGIFRYDPVKDYLCQRGTVSDLDALLQCVSVPEELISIRKAAAIFLFVGHPWRSMRKYGARGLRFLFLEAGAMMENIHLAITALGYASVDCASLYDDEVHEVLHVDGLYQSLLHAIVAGLAG